MENITIFVKDFSVTPGSRYIVEGKKAHSGEEFRVNFLEPKFIEATKNNAKIIVNLDGTIGYGTSWLEEVFGGLARSFGHQKVLDKLEFISEEEDYLIEDVKDYITNAEK